MGKAILIMTAAAFVGGATLLFGLHHGSLETTERTVAHEEQLLAREIARSASNMAISELKRDYTWRAPGHINIPFQGGIFDVTVTEEPNNSLLVVAVGSFSNRQYEIRTTLGRRGLGGSIIVDANDASVKYGGHSFRISGYDTSSSGVPALGPDTHGIAPTKDSVTEEFITQLNPNQIPNVKGVGGTPDVVTSDLHLDLDEIYDHIKENADTTYVDPSPFTGSENFGSNWDNPKIVVVEGDAKFRGNVQGHGILLVEGDLQIADSGTEGDFSGNFKWEGLVFIRNSSGFAMNYEVGFSGDAKIFGALLLQSESSSQVDVEFDIRGNAEIHYSTLALNSLVAPLLPAHMFADKAQVVILDQFEKAGPVLN